MLGAAQRGLRLPVRFLLLAQVSDAYCEIAGVPDPARRRHVIAGGGQRAAPQNDTSAPSLSPTANATRPSCQVAHIRLTIRSAVSASELAADARDKAPARSPAPAATALPDSMLRHSPSTSLRLAYCDAAMSSHLCAVAVSPRTAAISARAR